MLWAGEAGLKQLLGFEAAGFSVESDRAVVRTVIKGHADLDDSIDSQTRKTKSEAGILWLYSFPVCSGLIASASSA